MAWTRGVDSAWVTARILFAVCPVLLAPGLLVAQPTQEAPAAPRHAIEGELSYFGDSDANSSLDLVLVQLGGLYVIDERFSIAGSLGIATLVSTPARGQGDIVWRSSNPELIAYYGWPAPRDGRWSLRLGLGVAGPLATITRGPDARLHRAALSNAQGVDGLSRMWRWAPNRTSVLTSAELWLDAHEELALAFDVKPALLIPSREDFLQGGEDLDFIVPLALAGITGRGLLRGGCRLRAVWMPTSGVDQAQFAVEPFVGLFIASTFLELRYTLNLDEPLAGPRGPQVWGVHVRAGGSL